MKYVIALLLAATFVCGGTVAMAADEAFDLNKATVEQLVTIPGISEELAKAIVDTAKKAPFQTRDDLMKVPGLDNAALQAINPVEEEGSLWYDPENAEMVLAPSKC